MAGKRILLSPEMVGARQRLADFVRGLKLTPRQAREHSRLVAKYAAECVRDDRAARREPSVMDRIFGRLD